MPRTSITGVERVLLAIAFWPVWSWYLARTFDASDEPWQILAVVGLFVYLLRFRATENLPVSRTPALLGLTLYVAGYHSLPAIVRAAIAVFTLFFSTVPVRRIPPGGVILLLLCLPILPSLDFLLNYPLRRVTALLAVPLLDCAGFNVGVVGNSFTWNDRLVTIDGPCSGVRMLYTMMIVTAILATFLRLRLKNTAKLLTLGFVSVIAGNIFRSSALFFVEAKPFQPALFERFEPLLHQGAGLVLFVLSMGIVTAAAKYFSRQEATCS